MNITIIALWMAFQTPVLSEYDRGLIWMVKPSPVKGWNPACQSESERLRWLTGVEMKPDVDPGKRITIATTK